MNKLQQSEVEKLILNRARICTPWYQLQRHDKAGQNVRIHKKAASYQQNAVEI